MRYEILAADGSVENVVLADADFVEQHYPGRYRHSPVEPVTTHHVPMSCTRRQGRLALLAAGHLDDVEQAITAISDEAARRAAQIEYEAETWERASPFVEQMWASLGGTPEQLDDLFRMAVTL